VLSANGIQGYYTTTNSDDKIVLSPIYPIDFLSFMSFEKDNKIRVDAQNNKWIITKNGVWVIQENTSFWPTDEGFTVENSGLLSDIVYDVAFDNDKGIAYLSTEKGISVLNIPYTSNPIEGDKIALTPNPFITTENTHITISSIHPGSQIHIMKLNGEVIFVTTLSSQENKYIWNGIGNNGKPVNTGVYLVSASHPEQESKVTKLAIIR